jgi:hypothetical protein
MAQKGLFGNDDNDGDDVYCLLIKSKKDEICMICSMNGQGRISTTFGCEEYRWILSRCLMQRVSFIMSVIT